MKAFFATPKICFMNWVIATVVIAGARRLGCFGER